MMMKTRIEYKASLQLIRDAKNESERILRQAQEEAEMIRKQAMRRLMNMVISKATKIPEKGYQNGYDALPYRKPRKKLIKSSKMLYKTLNSAKVEYEAYLQDKKAEIIKLSINIAEHILNREVANVDGIDEMVVRAIEESRNAKSIIVKTNSLYTEHLKTKVLEWKERFALKAEVFVIMDDSLDKGEAVIEKNNGKVTISIDDALDNIREAIL